MRALFDCFGLVTSSWRQHPLTPLYRHPRHSQPCTPYSVLFLPAIEKPAPLTALCWMATEGRTTPYLKTSNKGCCGSSCINSSMRCGWDYHSNLRPIGWSMPYSLFTASSRLHLAVHSRIMKRFSHPSFSKLGRRASPRRPFSLKKKCRFFHQQCTLHYFPVR